MGYGYNLLPQLPELDSEHEENRTIILSDIADPRIIDPSANDVTLSIQEIDQLACSVYGLFVGDTRPAVCIARSGLFDLHKGVLEVAPDYLERIYEPSSDDEKKDIIWKIKLSPHVAREVVTAIRFNYGPELLPDFLTDDFVVLADSIGLPVAQLVNMMIAKLDIPDNLKYELKPTQNKTVRILRLLKGNRFDREELRDPEKSFAEAYLRYESDIAKEEILIRRVARGTKLISQEVRYAQYVIDNVIDGIGSDTTMFWTLAPYIYKKLVDCGLDAKGAICKLILWAKDGVTNRSLDTYLKMQGWDEFETGSLKDRFLKTVHLSGVTLEDDDHAWVLSDELNHISHRRALFIAEEVAYQLLDPKFEDQAARFVDELGKVTLTDAKRTSAPKDIQPCRLNFQDLANC